MKIFFKYIFIHFPQIKVIQNIPFDENCIKMYIWY